MVPICRCDSSAHFAVDDSKFVSEIAAYIAMHISEVTATSGLGHLSENMMSAVLSDSGLALKNELEVLRTACKWVKEQPLAGSLPIELEGEGKPPILMGKFLDSFCP
jgi:hypothetical protein